MDTGDLSATTYQAIMIEAERFDHNLTLQFGLLSDECTDEKDFIEKSKQLITEFLRYNNNEIDDLFFGEPPPRKAFHAALKKISDNISKLH